MTEERDPKEVLQEIQDGLAAATADERLGALESLQALSFSSAAILRLLEKMALRDRSKAVRAAALGVLQSRLHRRIQARRSEMAEFSRRVVLREIEIWQADGLMDEVQARVLSERYAYDMQPEPVEEVAPAKVVAPVKKEAVASALAAIAPKSAAVKVAAPPVPLSRSKPQRPKQTPAHSKPKRLKRPPAPPKPKRPKRTLAQTLFSETSIKVALYLGAFFTIAAATIFAFTVEALRLPILFFFTVAFAGGALALKKRLPQPSFTLFIIFSVLLPIDFAVIADQFNIVGQAGYLYWFFVYLFMTAVWVFSTWFFKSRFFSLVAFLALDLSVYNLVQSFNADVPVDLYLLLWMLVALLALGASHFVKDWQEGRISAVLNVLAQLQVLGLLFTSFVMVAAHYMLGDFERGWWLATTAIWWLAAAFYLLSNAFKPHQFFRIAAIASMTPLSFLFLNTFDANNTAQIVGLLVWGVLFAAAGEVFDARNESKFHEYGSWSIWAAAGLVGLSLFFGVLEDTMLAFWLFVSVALFYTLISIYRIRFWTWFYALLAVLGAYFLFYTFDFVSRLNLFDGFKYLIPGVLLLLPDLFLKNDFKADRAWRLPPRLLGAGLVVFNIVLISLVSAEHAAQVAVIYAVYALLGIGYAFRYAPEFAYSANIAFLMSVLYVLRDADAQHWLAPLTGLAVIYYVLGFGLARIERSRWALVYIWSGLVLGGLVALSAPFENLGTVKSVSVIIVAALFLLETFRVRSVRLALFANGFMLMAFVMILLDVQTDHANWYWWVAAAGMLIHYLIGYGLGFTDQVEQADVFRYGSLVAVTIASLSTLYFETELIRVIPSILALALFTLEAFRKKNTWLAIAANGFYLLTYFVLLDHFDSSPAWLYYLIVSAGMLLHYVIGWALERTQQPAMADIYRYGALLTALLASLNSLPREIDLLRVLPVLLAAALFTLETFWKKKSLFAFPANALYMLAYFMTLNYLDIKQMIWLYYVVATLGILIQYFGGIALERTQQSEVARIYRYGGLLTASLISLLALTQEINLWRVLPVFFTALLFTVETFRKKEVIWAFPANGFYILAYFMTLNYLDIERMIWLYYVAATLGILIQYFGGIALERTQQSESAKIYRYGGLLTASLISLLALTQEINLWRVLPVFFTALLFTVETFRKKEVIWAFPANGFYMLAYFMTLSYFDLHELWVYYLAAVVGMVFHYAVGVGLERTPTPKLADIYRYSGLLTALFVASWAPFRDTGLIKILPVVFAAVIFTFEAFHKRNLWFGFPANALYLLAYFMILNNFEIDQPQFYSIAAAALGMLMHYLLVRAESKTAAFITGMLSQLVLLSTTYIQLVSEEKLGYFIVLFFQALAVLIYGVVIRSRSMVIAPIIFLVVSVVTVTFGVLDGLPTIFLIGCTGVFLIAFGIGALLLRERFASLREQLDDWNA